jgi:pimeloyl-ACP methyl ester carboxylesterase
MRSRVGQRTVEITQPESAKFHHPLLLLHGLWTGTWIWEALTPFLAHRGWEVWAPSLVDAVPPESFAAAVTSIEAVARAMPAPPVLVMHDTGLVLGSALASHVDVPAFVALAPVLPGRVPLRRGLAGVLTRWRAEVSMPPPRGRGADALIGSVPRARERLVADSAPIVRALAAGRVVVAPPAGRPGLVLAGDRDAITPPAIAAELAGRFGWDARSYPGRGHLLQLETGWEEVGGDLHRWIVRTLGADLLALLEDDEER